MPTQGQPPRKNNSQPCAAPGRSTYGNCRTYEPTGKCDCTCRQPCLPWLINQSPVNPCASRQQVNLPNSTPHNGCARPPPRRRLPCPHPLSAVIRHNGGGGGDGKHTAVHAVCTLAMLARDIEARLNQSVGPPKPLGHQPILSNHMVSKPVSTLLSIIPIILCTPCSYMLCDVGTALLPNPYGRALLITSPAKWFKGRSVACRILVAYTDNSAHA